ncbi:unnamed protein product [Musa hybrid cultivar]
MQFYLDTVFCEERLLQSLSCHILSPVLSLWRSSCLTDSKLKVGKRIKWN